MEDSKIGIWGKGLRMDDNPCIFVDANYSWTYFKSILISPILWKPCRIKIAFNPLPDDKILDSSKLKQIADDILKCM